MIDRDIVAKGNGHTISLTGNAVTISYNLSPSVSDGLMGHSYRIIGERMAKVATKKLPENVIRSLQTNSGMLEYGSQCDYVYLIRGIRQAASSPPPYSQRLRQPR
jgi:hypothetical protein